MVIEQGVLLLSLFVYISFSLIFIVESLVTSSFSEAVKLLILFIYCF